MADNAGSFRFESNITAVVREIEGGLDRLRGSLATEGSTPLKLSGGLDTSAFEAELVAAKERIHALMADFASGNLSTNEFSSKFRSAINETVGNVPKLMADALSMSPESVASQIPAAQMGAAIGKEMVSSLINTLKSGQGEVGAAIKSLGAIKGLNANQFRTSLGALETAQPAYGQESTDRNRLTNQNRLESAAQLMANDRLVQDEYDPSWLNAVRATMDQRQKLAPDPKKFPASPVAGELKDVTAAESAAEKAEKKRVVEETKAEADERARAAQQLRAGRMDQQMQEAAEAAVRRRAREQIQALSEDERRTGTAEMAIRRRAAEQIQAMREDSNRSARAERDERLRAAQQIAAGREDEKRSSDQEKAVRKTAVDQIRAGKEDAKRSDDAEKAIRQRANQQIQALSEDERRTGRAEMAIRRRAAEQIQALREDEARTARAETQTRRVALDQIRAGKEDEKRTQDQENAERNRAVQQIRAQREDENRTATEEKNTRLRAAQQIYAQREDTRRTESAEKDVRSTASMQMAAQKINTELENANKLTREWANVVPVGQYQVLGNEVYRLTQLGAVQLENEASINRVLERRDGLLASAAMAEQRQSLTAAKRAAGEDASTAGFAGGFANKFSRGKGDLLTSVGAQVGSAASFSLGYGALFGMLGVVKDLQSEFADYQDSVTDLEVATQGSDAVTRQWVNSLGDLARVTGENVGAALDTAARGVRAFGNPLHDTTSELQAIGLAANDAANKLALIADKSLTDATGDAIAVGTAYGMQPDQLNQIVDAVANAKRSLGGDPGQISQGLASISSSAKAAGFDLNQAAAAISLVQARTDETGLAAATRLTRIFQTVSGSTGKKLGKELGVDTNQTAREQLMAYSKIYNNPDTSKAVKDRITSALGGTANLRELLPLLTEGARLTEAYGEANKHAGQGQAEFARKSDNLVGTIKKIRGDLKAIAVDVTLTGIAAPFGVLVRTVEPLLHLLDRMLQLFDQLPASVRATTATMVDLAIASKAVAVINAARAGAQANKAVQAGTISEAPALVPAFSTVATGSKGSVVRTAEGYTEVGARRAVGGQTLVDVAAFKAAQAKTPIGPFGEGSAANAKREAEALAAARGVATSSSAGALSSSVMGATGSAVGEERRLAVQAEIAGISAASANRIAAEEALNATVAAADVKRGAVEAAGLGEAGAGTGIKAGFKSLLGSVFNPITLGIGAAVGTAVLVNKGLDGMAQRRDFLNKYSDTATSLERGNGSAADLRASATDLRAVAGQIKQSDSNFVSKDEQKTLVKSLVQQRKDLGTLAKQVDAEQARNASVGSVATFGDGGVITTVDQLASGLKALADNGDDALQIVNAFGRALGNTATPDAKVFSRRQVSADLAKRGLGNLQDFLPDEIYNQPYKTALGGRGGGTKVTKYRDESLDEYLPDFRAANRTTDVADRIAAATKAAGIKQGSVLTEAQKQHVADLAASSFDLQMLGKDKADVKNRLYRSLLDMLNGGDGKSKGLIGDALNDVFNDVVAGAGGGKDKVSAKGLLNGKGGLSRANINQILKPSDNGDYAGLEATLGTAIGAVPADDNGPKMRAALLKNRNIARELVRRGRKMGVNVGELNRIAANAESAYVNAKVDNLEELRLVAQNDVAGNKAKVKGVGQDFLEKEIKAAGTDGKRLKTIMEMANKKMLALVRAKLVAAVELAAAGSPTGGGRAPESQAVTDAKNALDLFDKTEAIANVPSTGGDFATGDDAADVKAKEKASKKNKDHLTAAQLAAQRAGALIDPDRTIAVARNALRSARADLAAAKNNKDRISAQKAITDAEDGVDKAVADHASSIYQARAARTGGAIASARAAIQSASAGLKSYARGTTGWYQALGSFYDAQEQMRQAVLEYKANRDKLHGDITDPVENARDQLRADERALRAARNKEDRTAAAVAVRSDKAGLADTKFQQRLSDMQTGEELGRISFAKYMSYLDHEHDRLSAIHHRTRQQQTELDTIDKAIKDGLNSADSQFNLGDINTNGLVYQVRRFKAEMAGGGATSGMAASSNVTNNNQLTINGADITAVLRHVDKHLGINGGQRRALTRRKA